MQPAIVCHYDEIGLKGKNRDRFEQRLIENIKNKAELHGLGKAIKIKKLYGRILLKHDYLEHNQIEQWKRILTTTFGIANFSFGTVIDSEYNLLAESVLQILQTKQFNTFRITTQRADKSFPMNSHKINEEIGAIVIERMNKKVKLIHPDLECFIEVAHKHIIIYTEKIQGPGGLPIGISGHAIGLISGGIDSPVAIWYGLKRGLEMGLLHFHSSPYTPATSIEKVRELTQILKEYSPNLKLYLCPIGEIQKQCLFNVPDKYRIVIYRRLMMHIANKVATQEKAKAIITGESLGQVASQTLTNIATIGQASNILILRPLIGFDKKEIINQAKKINTFETSILHHDDCCTLFLPKQPETNAMLKVILSIEDKINMQEKVASAFEQIKIAEKKKTL